MERRGRDLPPDTAPLADRARRCGPRPGRSTRKTGMCRAIGGHGAELLADGPGVLTHCNAGGAGHRRLRHRPGRDLRRRRAGQDAPRLSPTRPGRCCKGARLTAWELQQRGIDVTLICDNMAAQVMREGTVQAGRSSGPTASPPTATRPTRSAPTAWPCWPRPTAFRSTWPPRRSTFDLSHRRRPADPDRAARPARDHARLRPADRPGGGIDVYNPAFDVTPAELIAAHHHRARRAAPAFPGQHRPAAGLTNQPQNNKPPAAGDNGDRGLVAFRRILRRYCL